MAIRSVPKFSSSHSHSEVQIHPWYVLDLKAPSLDVVNP